MPALSCGCPPACEYPPSNEHPSKVAKQKQAEGYLPPPLAFSRSPIPQDWPILQQSQEYGIPCQRATIFAKRRRSNPLLITSHSHNRTTMQFEVEVNVMPQRALLDPQGRAVKNTLQQAGYQGVVDVRMGKHIVLSLEANSEDEARQRVNTLCAKVLSNPVMEGFEYSIKAL